MKKVLIGILAGALLLAACSPEQAQQLLATPDLLTVGEGAKTAEVYLNGAETPIATQTPFIQTVVVEVTTTLSAVPSASPTTSLIEVTIEPAGAQAVGEFTGLGKNDAGALLLIDRRSLESSDGLKFPSGLTALAINYRHPETGIYAWRQVELPRGVQEGKVVFDESGYPAFNYCLRPCSFPELPADDWSEDLDVNLAILSSQVDRLKAYFPSGSGAVTDQIILVE